MRASVLVLRGLLYRWRTNLAVALGVGLGTAVLVAALGAGDSVRFSLRSLALARLGAITLAMEGGERYVRAELAGEISHALGGRAAAAIILRGSASARGGAARAPAVQVLGVSADFWDLAPRAAAAPPDADEALVNAPLAQQLGLRPGDELLIRVKGGSPMPADAPLSAGAGGTTALHVRVRAVLPESSLGNFSLRVNQVPSLNVFISRDALAARIARIGGANAILLAPGPGRTPADADAALARAWTLADAGLQLRRAGAGWELASERVFIDGPAERAAVEEGGRGVLTWFVERISRADRDISYSFVTAGAPRIGQDLSPGEVLLNRWAAGELGAGPGDTVRLEYAVPGTGEQAPLVTRTREFRVRGVVAIDPEDRTLMPAFPGLAGVKSCRDWDPGLPVDLSRIGQRDQEYWERYGGSPRAFISLETGQGLWANRFGRLTAVRFDTAGADPASLAARLSARLPPQSLGLAFRPVREIGLAASGHGVDFGQLFLGLSLFLVAASLLLTGLLFKLSVEQRKGDIRTLTAIGFSPARIRWLLSVEGALVALAGSALGIPLGLACHRGVLAGLRTVWKDAVRTPAVIPYVAPLSVAIAAAAGAIAGLLVIALASVRTGRSARREEAAAHEPRGLPAAVASFACLAASGMALGYLSAPARFLAAGALMLVGFLAASAFLLARMGRAGKGEYPAAFLLGLRSGARRRTRSLAVTSLLACGIFIVTAVAANKPVLPDPRSRESGTGGFALIAETSTEVAERTLRRLTEAVSPSTLIVGLRVLEGDDASCLNLNRAERPRILGIDPRSMEGRFSFISFAGERPKKSPWTLLDGELGPRTVPAVADQSVITYGLGLQVGDELQYRDQEGRPLVVRLVAGLAGSVLQGSILISESSFLSRFPSTSGFRMLLVDTRPADSAAARRGLERALSGSGLSVVSTADRLAELFSVENAYLLVFALLGWLGMLIGTAGLTVVVARNMAESRGELALLRAVGFGSPALMKIVMAEHLLPIGLGVAGGFASSAVAVLPAAPLSNAAPGILVLLAPALALAAFALACIALGALLALRAELLRSLRNE